VPLYERFFQGGILSIRGFAFNDLGPQAALPSFADPGGSYTRIRIGGNAMLRTNIEIEFPIVTAVGIKGVVFFDAGNVWNTDRNYCQLTQFYPDDPSRRMCDFNQLRTSAGFGVRWFSPMGPLRFEWGFPINPRLEQREQRMRFDFTIGQFF
jgi:outer membrane protein insertion porin family